VRERTKRRELERGSESISAPVLGAGSLESPRSTEDVGEHCSGGPGRGKGGTADTESFLRNTEGALKPESVSTKQERIAILARRNTRMAFTSLNHYVDYEWVKCLRVHAQGRRGRSRRRDRGRLCGQPGAEPSQSDRATQIGPLSSAAGSTALHTEIGRWTARARHSVLRGQGGATSHRDAARADLRTGLSGLLVWLSAGSQCASSAARHLEHDHGVGWTMGAGR